MGVFEIDVQSTKYCGEWGGAAKLNRSPLFALPTEFYDIVYDMESTNSSLSVAA